MGFLLNNFDLILHILNKKYWRSHNYHAASTDHINGENIQTTSMDLNSDHDDTLPRVVN